MKYLLTAIFVFTAMQAHAKPPEAFDLSTGNGSCPIGEQHAQAASDGPGLIETLWAIHAARRGYGGGLPSNWAGQQVQQMQQQQQLDSMQFQMRMNEQQRLMSNGGYGG